jgi:hypothetical protein
MKGIFITEETKALIKHKIVELESVENSQIGNLNQNIAIGKRRAYEEILSSAEITTDVAIKFAEFLCTYPDKNRNVYGDMLHAKSKYDSSYTTKEVFKEFINNHYGK